MRSIANLALLLVQTDLEHGLMTALSTGLARPLDIELQELEPGADMDRASA